MKNFRYRLGNALFNYLTCVPNGDKRVIVSTFGGTGYESINTHYTPSVRLLKLSYRMMDDNTTTFEMFNPTKDQVTYHSPWTNMY